MEKLTIKQTTLRVDVATMLEQPWQSAVEVDVTVFLVIVVVGPGQPQELLTMAVVVIPLLLEQTCAELLEGGYWLAGAFRGIAGGWGLGFELGDRGLTQRR